MSGPAKQAKNFYPRPPRGGRPGKPVRFRPPVQISIHALREEGDLVFYRGQQNRIISIHALREEGDGLHAPSFRRCYHISIHALREEGDAVSAKNGGVGEIFLSTPSARRATIQIRPPKERGDISIHALREEGDFGSAGKGGSGRISIHALREEGD